MTSEHRRFIGGAWTTGLGTLASRVLGLLRDIATAALLGLGETGVMDAFVIAVRIPNLFRRIFGEGALTASFLPVFASEHERSAALGWKLASAVLVWLSGALAVVVLVLEMLLAVAWLWAREIPSVSLVIGLVAANLPYVMTICIASLFAAMLQSLGYFALPALAPTLLNICWLAGAWWIAPTLSSSKVAQAWILVGCIQIAGLLQIFVQWPALRSVGFRFNFDWQASRESAKKIGRAVAAVAFGLTITQINTLLDSLIGWVFSAPPGAEVRMEWLGGVAYPLTSGAASAIHYGERFYQLPMGIVGFAIATAVFPLLSRHAARGDRQLLGSDLTLALRLTLFISVPAGVGLMLIADPLARLLYQHGSFSADDATRTGRMIMAYSSAVWAFCAAPVVVRGFYALADQQTPVRVGLITMAFNTLLDFSLIWWVGEVGLAVSTALAAILQLVMLVIAFSVRYGSIDWSDLGFSAIRTVFGSAVMAGAVFMLLHRTAVPEAAVGRAALLLGAIAVGAGIYGMVAWLTRAAELRLLLGKSPEITPSREGEAS